MRYIAGIKPTGTPHLGNYLSMMKPIFDLAKDKNNIIYYFIADGHALTTQPRPETMKENVQELCNTLFSLGIQDYDNVILYRQSQIPEIFELFWMVSCFTSKGLLNRNHTYMVEKENNIKKKEDPDKGINMGMFNYPVLMAADILSVGAEKVIVGKDQKQHIDITRDIAERMNSFYNENIFTLPEEYYAREGVEDIPGLDGRKMSKSYNNVIPLFCSEKELRKLIFSIPTNSKNVGEVKYREESNVCYLIEQFGDISDTNYMDILLESGSSWGEIKQLAFEIINDSIQEYRESYNYYNNIPEAAVEGVLKKQEESLKFLIDSNLRKLKENIGFMN